MAPIELSASQEDYLEAIYLIAQEKHAARAKDIAQALKVRASSVTSALRTLSALGLVNYTPYDLITLTSEGDSLARDIVARHQALNKFLVTVLGVEPVDADKAACRLEHAVSKPILERFIKYAEYVERCPRGGITWESGFGYYCTNNCNDTDCSHCKRPGSRQENN